MNSRSKEQNVSDSIHVRTSFKFEGDLEFLNMSMLRHGVAHLACLQIRGSLMHYFKNPAGSTPGLSSISRGLAAQVFHARLLQEPNHGQFITSDFMIDATIPHTLNLNVV